MDTLPEFVLDVVEEWRQTPAPRNGGTGWETVRFQVDEEPEPSSVFSTAALAP
jgi:hypothetical protein